MIQKLRLPGRLAGTCLLLLALGLFLVNSPLTSLCQSTSKGTPFIAQTNGVGFNTFLINVTMTGTVAIVQATNVAFLLGGGDSAAGNYTTFGDADDSAPATNWVTTAGDGDAMEIWYDPTFTVFSNAWTVTDAGEVATYYYSTNNAGPFTWGTVVTNWQKGPAATGPAPTAFYVGGILSTSLVVQGYPSFGLPGMNAFFYSASNDTWQIDSRNFKSAAAFDPARMLRGTLDGNEVISLACEVNSPGEAQANTNGAICFVGYAAAGTTNYNLGGFDFIDAHSQAKDKRNAVIRPRCYDASGTNGGCIYFITAPSAAPLHSFQNALMLDKNGHAVIGNKSYPFEEDAASALEVIGTVTCAGVSNSGTYIGDGSGLTNIPGNAISGSFPSLTVQPAAGEGNYSAITNNGMVWIALQTNVVGKPLFTAPPGSICTENNGSRWSSTNSAGNLTWVQF